MKKLGPSRFKCKRCLHDARRTSGKDYHIISIKNRRGRVTKFTIRRLVECPVKGCRCRNPQPIKEKNLPVREWK